MPDGQNRADGWNSATTLSVLTPMARKLNAGPMAVQPQRALGARPVAETAPSRKPERTRLNSVRAAELRRRALGQQRAMLAEKISK